MAKNKINPLKMNSNSAVSAAPTVSEIPAAASSIKGSIGFAGVNTIPSPNVEAHCFHVTNPFER